MARGRKTSKKQDYSKYLNKALSRSTKKSPLAQRAKPVNPSWFEQLQKSSSKQSPTNLILGVLIVAVLVVLAFNHYSNKTQPNPSLQIDSQQTQASPSSADVSKQNLPGKYTVKDGDTLFSIAQSYYNNGYLYPKLADANKLSNPDDLAVGQVLDIPKLDTSLMQNAQPVAGGVGGATNQTVWGPAINTDTYTVVAGDWLSKIAGRAYGDIMSYPKIAQANSIQNPDEIEVGQVLKIPR